jgi:hypothetical protein
MLQTYGSPLPVRSSRVAENGAAYDGYTVERYRGTRHWSVYDPAGALVCVAVYKCGAEEVVRRLRASEHTRDYAEA